MVTYVEIKKLIAYFVGYKCDVDSENDIEVYAQTEDGNRRLLVFSNTVLKNAFTNMQKFNCDNLQLYSDHSSEVAVKKNIFASFEEIEDNINKLKYNISFASLEYCLFILSKIIEKERDEGFSSPVEPFHNQRYINCVMFDGENDIVYLSKMLNLFTCKLEAEKPTLKLDFDKYRNSFEFLYMYRNNFTIYDYKNIVEVYPSMSHESRQANSYEKIDRPPASIINFDILPYYAKAIDTADCFSKYISYYHIIEYFFDAIFKKKLTEDISRKIASPDFSYKNEDKLYELARYIKKHMKSDDESGKGDEFESLKYVLQEYVDLPELTSRILTMDKTALNYYETENIPFLELEKPTKINWKNKVDAIINIANRIYKTRNSLVHSKSGYASNLYKPYEHDKYLKKEIPLIRAVAEQVMVNTSERI